MVNSVNIFNKTVLNRESKGGYTEGKIEFHNIPKDQIERVELDLVEVVDEPGGKVVDVHPNVLFISENERKSKGTCSNENKKVSTPVSYSLMS